jgi:hypothetical protein
MRNIRMMVCLLTVLGTASAETPEQFFDNRVEPILRTRCLACHNEILNDGLISFTDPEGLLRGGSRGPTIVPGKPNESVLIETVRQNGDVKMPPGGKLSSRDVATLTEWIERGGAWGTKLRISPEEKSANLFKRCFNCHSQPGTP